MKSIGVISLGCSKNRVDSEVMIGILARRGYDMVDDPARAEIIIVNTCGFIEAAKQESIDAILEMAEYKKSGCRRLIVTGCLSQRYSGQLFSELPEVDAFLGVSEYEKIVEAIEAVPGKRPVFTGEGRRFLREDRVLTTPPYSAYVKISDGCDNRCTYCAIPLIRGGYHSRPYSDIIGECAALAAAGASELTLIAQDTSRYGNDLPGGKLLLPDLLREVSEIAAAHWLRVLYCYPDTVTERLLDEVADNKKICPYLDLPLQHIDARILREMNRRGNPGQIRKIIADCRDRGIMVRTTFIVGFPGESESDFDELVDFVREAKFDRMGAFAYSPEDDTPAALMPGQIDEETKHRRLDELMLMQREISTELGRLRVGHECEVLVEERIDGTNRYSGRSMYEAPEIDGVIEFTSDRELITGEYVNVRIYDSSEYDLYGEICEK